MLSFIALLNSLSPLLLLCSLIAFIITTIIWVVWHKRFPKIFYGSLSIIAFLIYLWAMVNSFATVLHITNPDFVYRTDLPFPKLMGGIYVTSWFALVYSSIALLVAFVRKMLKRPIRQLLIYALTGVSIGLAVILWQFAAPCEYTPKGCWTDGTPQAPSLPR